MMDPVIKARWIEALLSGKYVQGREYLERTTKSGQTWCCLGVLMDVQRAGSVQTEFEDPAERMTDNLPSGLNAGLTQSQCKDLAQMNDGSGERMRQSSFAEIAKHISENL